MVVYCLIKTLIHSTSGDFEVPGGGYGVHPYDSRILHCLNFELVQRLQHEWRHGHEAFIRCFLRRCALESHAVTVQRREIFGPSELLMSGYIDCVKRDRALF